MRQVSRLPVLLVLAVVLGLAATGAMASGRRAPRRPDVPQLLRKALRKVHQADHGTFARAVILEADGITRGGACTADGCTGGRPTHHAAGVIAWRFVFQNTTAHSRFASATITYGPPPRGFGQTQGHVQPFLEDVAIRRIPQMTLARAVTLLRAAGYGRAFQTVTLRNPLGPKRSNPLYIFGLNNGHFVAVDTRTGRVSPIS